MDRVWVAKIARILTVYENNQGTRAQSPLGRTVQVRMTLQGDVMAVNDPERHVILPGSSILVCKDRPG
jgi:hypothetical protein